MKFLIYFGLLTITVGMLGCSNREQVQDTEISAPYKVLTKQITNGSTVAKLQVEIGKYSGTQSNLWGSEVRIPEMVIKSITMESGGKTITIPKHTFRDLSEVHYETQIIFLETQMPSFELKGGDGHFTYVAEFRIERGEFSKRKIKGCED